MKLFLNSPFLSVLILAYLYSPFLSFAIDASNFNESKRRKDINLHEFADKKDSIKLKNLDILLPASTYPAHSAEVTSIIVADDGKSIYSSSVDGKVMKHSFKGEGEKENFFSEVLYSSDKAIFSMSISSNKKYLAISQSSLILVMDLETKGIVRGLTQVYGRITTLAWDPRGEFLVFGLSSGEVYAWKLLPKKNKNTDSKKFLEKYTNSLSPIKSIVFHPSARAFFVAQKSGVISLWRLLRTESEMGLRDKEAIVDRDSTGHTRSQFAKLGVDLERIMLSDKGDYLLAVGADGFIYSWKIRGRRFSEVLVLKGDSVTSFLELSSFNKVKEKRQLFATADRGHTVKIWCLKDVKGFRGNSALDSLEEQEREKLQNSIIRGAVVRRPLVLAKSEVLDYSVNNLAISSSGGLLWGSQKTGNLVSFDVSSIINVSPLLNYCSRDSFGAVS